MRQHPSRRRLLAFAGASFAGGCALAAPLPLRAAGGDPRAAFSPVFAPVFAPVFERARALPQARAMALRLDGAPAGAEAFRGPDLSRPAPVKSVSKTIVAALLGAALDRGEAPSVRASLAETAPQLIPRGADPRVGAITLEDLVTMRAGLERTSGANYGPWAASRNWVADALSRPFVAEPGGPMLYSTGSFHVLGAVLSEISGKTLLRLARERLGAPLGMAIPAWTRDPQGRYLGGNEMALTLEAMLRFGELYRNGGRHEGAQALSAAWVAASLTERTRSPWSGLGYGYGWFLGEAAGTRYALARGYGGQLICVAPGAGLTMALTSDPAGRARSGGYFDDLSALIEESLIPAARAARGEGAG